jgi:hypothetical protein
MFRLCSIHEIAPPSVDFCLGVATKQRLYGSCQRNTGRTRVVERGAGTNELAQSLPVREWRSAPRQALFHRVTRVAGVAAGGRGTASAPISGSHRSVSNGSSDPRHVRTSSVRVSVSVQSLLRPVASAYGASTEGPRSALSSAVEHCRRAAAGPKYQRLQQRLASFAPVGRVWSVPSSVALRRSSSRHVASESVASVSVASASFGSVPVASGSSVEFRPSSVNVRCVGPSVRAAFRPRLVRIAPSEGPVASHQSRSQVSSRLRSVGKASSSVPVASGCVVAS